LPKTLIDVQSISYHYVEKHKASLLKKILNKNPAINNKTDKSKNDRPGVQDISFSLAKGEILGFLGENGAGKSTTMRLLTGEISPHKGRITINGFDLYEQGLLARRHIGFLPDTPPIYNNMTVDEYLLLCAQLHKLQGKKQQYAIDYCKERCGLTDVSQRLTQFLSKGFKQRLGIAQAIIHQPEVIILDEPTSGLDPVQLFQIHELIAELGKNHSIIIASHNLAEIQKLCDRIQIIHRGELIYQQKTDAFTQLADCHEILISCANLTQISPIQNLTFVSRVKHINTMQFLIHCEAQDATIENTDSSEDFMKSAAMQIIQMSVEKDWQLYEISMQKPSLEAIFKQMITAKNS